MSKGISISLIVLAFLQLTGLSQADTRELSCVLPTGGRVKVCPVRQQVIHVRYEWPDMKPPESLIVPQIDRPACAATIQRSDSVSILTTDLIEVRLDRESGMVSFFDRSGKKLLTESGREGEKYDFKGKTLLRTEQRWAADESEAYYGLGQHEHAVMNYQGQKIHLEQGNKSAVSTFVVSSGGYGLLWDVNCVADFDATAQGEINFTANAALGQDYYFIYGPDYDAIIQGYRELTGTAPMFPRWAYGYQQSKERYATQQEVLDTAAKFRELGFPIDLIIQDWRYWGGNPEWSGMIWDPTRFPDPDAMIERLHDSLHMKFMAVIWPFIGTNTELFRVLEDKGGFFEGKSALSGGKLYNAYDEKFRDIYWDYANRGLFQRGLDAWWMDGSEPEGRLGFSGDTGGYGPFESCHNAYSLIHTEGVYKNQRKVSDAKRVYILTRSAYAGQQRTGGATWSGDIHSTWDVLKEQIDAGVNFSMSGLPYWTMDIGAFYVNGSYKPAGNKHPGYRELYTRWFQFGAFCPLFRSHGTNTAREPWHFGDTHYDVLKSYTELRYRLMPYIYSLAGEVTQNHGTMMRGLPMDFPADKHCATLSGQYLFGPAFLVRPVTQPAENDSIEIIPSESLFTTTGKQGGLSAEYFIGKNFEQSAKKTVDQTINFNWSIEAPIGLPRNGYSARWQGQLLADVDGEYTIMLTADDGVRLWIDGQLVIVDWKERAAKTLQTKLSCVAGSRHDIKVEYFQGKYDAQIDLMWLKPIVSNAAEEQITEVYLPACEGWYDFWTGTFHDGGQTLSRKTPIEVMPLYVRAGSIVPMGPTMQYVTEKPTDPIELRIYPGRNASFTLYEDENDSYNYEKGAFSLIRFTWDDKTRQLSVAEREGQFPGMLTKRTFRVVVVTDKHGIGPDTTEQVDAIIHYNGSAKSVKLN